MTASAAVPPRRRRIAVVGSGVAGLTAAWVLQRATDVTLFEADGRLGGHAHTHDIPTADGRFLPVDTGFIVHNGRTYPLLLRLFAELGVTTQASEMSMSVHCDECGLEYAGAKGLTGLFPTAGTVARPRYLWMLREVVRFQRRARRLLGADRVALGSATLASFLRAGSFSRYFVQHFVTPLVSCVWSCAPGQALEYPAGYLFTFLHHHGLLQITGSPQWRTVVGGSRSYVERVGKELTAVLTSTPVRAVTRRDGGVEVIDDAGTVHRFEGAVISTHPDQTLALLTDPTPDERRVLGAFRYSVNDAVLHTDRRLLPRRTGAQASWNYRLDRCASNAAAVRVSYDLTRLQRLPSTETLIETLNDGGRIPPERVLARMRYEHPIYTPESVAGQQDLPGLNSSILAFAGAYHGWGFHEDGARAGVAAAKALGVDW